MPVVLIMGSKTNKELAYLYELFVATDWGERFAELIDEHLTLPKKGRVLYVGSGTGGHAIALQEHANIDLEFICVEENEEYNELARAKATALKDAVWFHEGQVDRLDFADNHFDLVIGDASLIPTERVRGMLSELVRVAAPEALVALTLPTFSSFGEFFSIYWEALHNVGLLGHESNVELLIMELPSVSDIEMIAEDEGLNDVESWTSIEEFDFESGEQFLNAPLVAEFLMKDWLASVPEESRTEVLDEITRLINEERHEAAFALSVKATLLIGRKTHNH